MSDGMDRRELRQYDPYAIILGSKVYSPALTAGGRPMVFTQEQMAFLIALQKMQSVAAAAISVGKPAEWAEKFLSSPKFTRYVNQKMEQHSAKSGMTVEAWFQFGKWVMDGKRIFYRGLCAFCQQGSEFTQYEIEASRDDDGNLHVKCPICFQPVDVDEQSEPFRPSREQIEVWKECGSRIIPKVERVHHEFEKTEFTFETGA